ncbi:hypothetical protein XAC908_660046 [Xanthomonas citri pv. citri]|nr:hypothetical protein XAC908_660046 [Xanthomonas citri pv. citri]
MRIAHHVVAERNHRAVVGMALDGIDFIARRRSEYVCSARLHPGAVSTIRRSRDVHRGTRRMTSRHLPDQKSKTTCTWD